MKDVALQDAQKGEAPRVSSLPGLFEAALEVYRQLPSLFPCFDDSCSAEEEAEVLLPGAHQRDLLPVGLEGAAAGQA